MIRNLSLLIVISVACTIWGQHEAGLITGASTLRLTGPVTTETSTQARTLARTAIKKELLDWLKEYQGLSFDTLNKLDNYHLDLFVNSCIKKAREESAFKGMIWSFSYILTPENVAKTVREHNTFFDTLAVQSWKNFVQALIKSDFVKIYKDGIRTLAYTNAHFGPPIIIPGLNTPLIDTTRTLMQQFIDSIRIRSTDMVLSGKAGLIPQNRPAIEAFIDATPLAGIGFSAYLPDNTLLVTGITNESGIFTLENMKIPFVSNGTFLYVSPNPGYIIDSGLFLKLSDFGIRSKNNQDQTFMFKLEKTTYRLNYRVIATDGTQFPPDISNSGFISKFFQDSCYLIPVASNGNPDLDISVTANVSMPQYDQTAEHSQKADIMITVKSAQGSQTEQFEYEKRYEKGINVSAGLFFWEVNNRIRTGFRNILERM